MSDKKSYKARRKLLKSIVAGSGAVIAGKSLPESWSRPVVDSVILPSHAQTSIRTFSSSVSIGSDQASLTPDSIYARSLDVIIPSAIASHQPFVVEAICVKDNGNDTADVDALLSDPESPNIAIFSAQAVPVSGGLVAFNRSALCEISMTMLDGFIRKANAGGPVNSDAFSIRVDSINGSALGSIVSDQGRVAILDLPERFCSSVSCNELID